MLSFLAPAAQDSVCENVRFASKIGLPELLNTVVRESATIEKSLPNKTMRWTNATREVVNARIC